MDVQVLLVLRVCVGQCDCPWSVHWDGCEDIRFNGHGKDRIAAVIDMLSCPIWKHLFKNDVYEGFYRKCKVADHLNTLVQYLKTEPYLGKSS